MSLGHGEDSDLEAYLLCLYCCSNRVAKVNLSYLLFGMGVNGTVLTLSSYFNQLFHVFHVLFIRFGIPKNNAELHSVSLLVSKHKNSIRQITPFVIWSYSSNINTGTSCNGHPQTRPFPSDVIDSLCVWNAQIFEVVSFAIKKLNNCSLLFIFQRAASYCKHGATGIPFNLVQDHRSIDGYWILILVVFHQD